MRPVPVDMQCQVLPGNLCSVTSLFGWELWTWECDNAKMWKDALHRAKRYVAERADVLFNRSAGSIDALLPMEFVKIFEELNAKGAEESGENLPFTVKQLLTRVLKPSHGQLHSEFLDEPNSPPNESDEGSLSPRSRAKNEELDVSGLWVFGDPQNFVGVDHLKELISSEEGFDTLHRFTEREYWYVNYYS